MILVQPDLVEGVRRATAPADLYPFLQAAIELELATIPLYLTAYFSLKPGANEEVGSLVRSIVIEEMLHMVIAANVLNALGGDPRLDDPTVVPTYPGPLPLGIDDAAVLHLAPMSMDQVEAFMGIEEPEDPQEFPVAQRAEALGLPTFETIGSFYGAIIDKIRELGRDAFDRPSHPQVTGRWFPVHELSPVTGVKSAVAGLELVVRQGEGTRKDPLDPEGDAAHYYRFAEVRNGRRLVADPTSPKGYSYSGSPVVFDPGGVWPLLVDPAPERYPTGSRSRRLVDQFDHSYTRLLRSLHATFNGRPGKLDEAIGLMYELRLAALAMVTEPDPVDGGLVVAPCWRYVNREA